MATVNNLNAEVKLTVPFSKQTDHTLGTKYFSLPTHVILASRTKSHSYSSSNCECENESETDWTLQADWFLDSGASLHFTPYPKDFASFEELKPENFKLV